MTHPFLSYAQTGEDVLLWRALGDQTPGFYVDAGASDPTFLSVTRALYDRGWRGIDIEPLPEKAAQLRAARPRNIVIEAALSDAPGHATLYCVDLAGDTGLSTFDQASAHQSAAQTGAHLHPIDVTVTTLATVCHAHAPPEIHFLKIDVEGAEAAVLRGADFRAFRPWIVLIEATRPGSGDLAIEWEGLLLQAGYHFVWFDGLNRFYLATERHAALAAHFTAPPNPFDHYEIYDASGIADRAKLDSLARERLTRINQLEAELAAQRQPVPKPPPPTPPPPPPPPPPVGAVRRMLQRARRLLLGSVPAELAAIREQQSDIRARLEDALRESAATTIDAKLTAAIDRALQASVAPMLDEKLAETIDRALQALVVERDSSR